MTFVTLVERIKNSDWNTRANVAQVVIAVLTLLAFCASCHALNQTNERTDKQISLISEQTAIAEKQNELIEKENKLLREQNDVNEIRYNPQFSVFLSSFSQTLDSETKSVKECVFDVTVINQNELLEDWDVEVFCVASLADNSDKVFNLNRLNISYANPAIKTEDRTSITPQGLQEKIATLTLKTEELCEALRQRYSSKGETMSVKLNNYENKCLMQLEFQKTKEGSPSISQRVNLKLVVMITYTTQIPAPPRESIRFYETSDGKQLSQPTNGNETETVEAGNFETSEKHKVAIGKFVRVQEKDEKDAETSRYTTFKKTVAPQNSDPINLKAAEKNAFDRFLGKEIPSPSPSPSPSPK